MKRVVHVLRKFDPKQWGGTETHVAEVTRRLREHGWSSEVHAPAQSGVTDRGLSSDVPLIRYRAFLPFLGSSEKRRALWANAGNIVSFEEPLRCALDRGIKLAHLHTQGRIGGSVRSAMRLTGRKYVVSVHGPLLAHPEWLAADTRKRTRKMWDVGKPWGALVGARHVITDAARVITFNEEERVALAARIGDRAVRMDHGVDIERLRRGDAARARLRWNQVGDAPIVSLVGRLSAQKNQVFAVQAFARGAPSSYHLMLAGAETDQGIVRRVQEEARNLGVHERVHILGNLNPHSEVPDLLAMTDLLLVPSTHEAFGLAVLEGWAAKRAVLFPRHSGLIDLAASIRDHESTLADLDLETWTRALQKFLSSPELRIAAVEQGHRVVQERFTWDKVTERLARLYEEVMSE